MPSSTSLLSRSQWQAARRKHRQRMQAWTEPFRDRRLRHAAHPVHDFLFVYYQYSPAKLEQWHPGIGITLQQVRPEERQACGFGAPYRQPDNACESDRNTVDLHCDPRRLDGREQKRLAWMVDLLRRIDSRTPQFGCFGLHEWAMVYRGQEIRHAGTAPLRLPQCEIDRTVESLPLTCTHFDAFRFFAEPAQPLNRHQPTLEQRPQLEQPACIHANMDLYKWAFKSMPWVGSDLLADSFDLAIEARRIDMRASPYDLSEFESLPPIRIETVAGRTQYQQLQREIHAAARPVRQRLIRQLDRVLEQAA